MKLYLPYANGLEGYFEKRKEYSGLKLLTLVSRDFLLKPDFRKDIDEIVDMYREKGIAQEELVFAFNNDYNKTVFTNKELENLKELRDYFAQRHIAIGVYHERGFHTYEKVKKTCEIIREKVNEIKSYHYSPTEKLMHAYLMSANNEYVSGKDDYGDSSGSRSLYESLNGEARVCVAFASELNVLITEMNDENVKCFNNTIGLIEKKKNGPEICAHVSNLVYLKDEKYKLDGFYICDVTKDYLVDGGVRIAFFLVDAKDIGLINGNDKTRDIGVVDKMLLKNWIEYYGYNADEDYSNCDNYVINSDWERTLSYTNDGLNFLKQDEIDVMHQETLKDYLLTRQDFKDYLCLAQTARDCKNSKEDFEECFNKNYKIANEDATKLKVFRNKKILAKYLKKHSSKVDMKEIIDGLSVVIKNFYKGKTKDERSKIMHDMIKDSIAWAKYSMSKDASSDFSKSEEIE